MKKEILTGNQAYIQKLNEGETISFRSKGNSMTPKIQSGQKCTYAPVKQKDDIKIGDMVFCKVGGRIYTHLLTAIKGDDKQGFLFQISNNHGHTNGWTSLDKIYGKVIKIED